MAAAVWIFNPFSANLNLANNGGKVYSTVTGGFHDTVTCRTRDVPEMSVPNESS
jgi:hypothetical protein